ncbi:MAG: SLC13/DASS family transporter [Deltaproteobacteria bacterium]|nr:SLC13/DASS family transporter [Deltaproteobacteria bacterium]
MSDRKRYQDLFEARETFSPAEIRFEYVRRTLGLFLGPLAFALLVLLPPASLPLPAARLAAVLAWVLIWWATEAVPLPITALLGPSLCVVTGVGKAAETFAPFGDPIIFLFLGSFILAEAMYATRLDRRFAFAILARPAVSATSTRIFVVFGLITAGMSAWLSNTATAAMMYPIGMSILSALSQLLSSAEGRTVDLSRLRYGTALMLVVAYGASIGGIATPVGTPPNLVAIGQLESLAGIRISFFQWMVMATPIMLVMLATLLVYLRLALPPESEQIPGSTSHVAEERRALGPWTSAQRNVLIAFLVTVALWVLPGLLALFLGTDAPLYRTTQRYLPEGVVALLGALLLFVLPVDWRQRQYTMTWNNAARIDWGTLLLFGGGLSLGDAMFKTGLSKYVGQAIVGLTHARSPAALSYLFGATAMALTETTSNVAATTMVCPLAIAAAKAAGISPVAPAVSSALTASMAFLLPVSTAPNAIVYGSGCVPITAMLRHGAVLDLVGLVIIPGAVLLLSRLLGLA